MSYITGSWENVHLYCGCHRKPKTLPDGTLSSEEVLVEMELKNGPSSVFYSCPHYYPQHRFPGEKACYNRLNLSDCEKMLSHIADVVIDADEKGIVADVTNMEWKVKGVEFKVLRADEGRTDVRVINNPALRGTRMKTFDV